MKKFDDGSDENPNFVPQNNIDAMHEHKYDRISFIIHLSMW